MQIQCLAGKFQALDGAKTEFFSKSSNGYARDPNRGFRKYTTFFKLGNPAADGADQLRVQQASKDVYTATAANPLLTDLRRVEKSYERYESLSAASRNSIMSLCTPSQATAKHKRVIASLDAQ